MRTIRTARLRLAPVTTQNAAVLWALLQQPDLRAFQDLPALPAGAFAQNVAKRPGRLAPGTSGRFEWLLHQARSRKAMGWVSLRIAERDLEAAEIGYSLLREHRGNGYATEAVSALLAEAFTEAGLRRVNAYCVPGNDRSRAVLARLRMRESGVLPHGATVGGQPVDVILHTIERDAWVQSGKTIVIPASAYPA